MKRQRIVLLFKDNVVVSLEPLNVDAEKAVDAMLGEMVVGKSKSWCG